VVGNSKLKIGLIGEAVVMMEDAGADTIAAGAQGDSEVAGAVRGGMAPGAEAEDVTSSHLFTILSLFLSGATLYLRKIVYLLQFLGCGDKSWDAASYVCGDTRKWEKKDMRYMRREGKNIADMNQARILVEVENLVYV